MDAQELQKFKTLYLVTTTEQLNEVKKLSGQLLIDSSNKQIIYSLYTLIHTIASKSFIMGYENTGEFCRNIEKKLRKAVENSEQILPDFPQELQNDIGKIQNSIDSIKSLDKEQILIDN